MERWRNLERYGDTAGAKVHTKIGVSQSEEAKWIRGRKLLEAVICCKRRRAKAENDNYRLFLVYLDAWEAE